MSIFACRKERCSTKGNDLGLQGLKIKQMNASEISFEGKL